MLAEAIESVLSQRNVDLEVIVIDDCSTDGTEEFVKSLTDERIQYFRNDKNSGQEYSRMNGLRHARGRYITFLDDDDYYTNYDFFQKAIKIFGEHGTEDEPLAFVCANEYSLNVTTGEKKLHNLGRLGRVKGIDYILNPCNEYKKPLSVFPAVFKAEVLKKAGLENMIIFDSMTYFESAMYGDVWLMSDIIGEYRVHGESATLGYKNHKSNEDRLYTKVLKSVERYEKLAVKLYAAGDKKSIDDWCIKKCIFHSIITKPGAKVYLKLSGYIEIL